MDGPVVEDIPLQPMPIEAFPAPRAQTLQRNGRIAVSKAGNSTLRNDEEQMERAMLAACRRPTRESDVKYFQTLHNPRLHGMTEWILQYEDARQRQDFYLDELKELRQRFSVRGKEGAGQSESPHVPRKFWSPAWEPLMPTSSPRRRKNRNTVQPAGETCVLFTKSRSIPIPLTKTRLTRPDYWRGSQSVQLPYSSFQPVQRNHSFRENRYGNSRSSHTNNDGGDSSTVDDSHQRYINIVTNYNNVSYSPSKGGGPGKLPPIGSPGQRSQLTRQQTDFEPIERISRRNKLNLTSFLREERARASSQASIDLSEVRVTATPIPCSR